MRMGTIIGSFTPFRYDASRAHLAENRSPATASRLGMKFFLGG